MQLPEKIGDGPAGFGHDPIRDGEIPIGPQAYAVSSRNPHADQGIGDGCGGMKRRTVMPTSEVCTGSPPSQEETACNIGKGFRCAPARSR